MLPHRWLRPCPGHTLFVLPWLLLLFSAPAAADAACADFTGETSEWHGFKRVDFRFQGRKAHVVLPSEPLPDRPWIWRARFPNHQTAPDLMLLERGFHVAHVDGVHLYGGPEAQALWDAFYAQLTGRHCLAPKPGLVAVSRGGLFAYTWAARHPERVACIYADTPVLDFKSWPAGRGAGKGAPADWTRLRKVYGLSRREALRYDGNPIDRLAPLAEADIPLLNVISLNDAVVPPAENTLLLVERYRALGGRIDVISVPEGTTESDGHHFPHPDPAQVAEFLAGCAAAAD